MKLYRAETGQTFYLNKEKNIESLKQLYLAITRYTSIPSEQQILMTSSGNTFKQKDFERLIKATHKDQVFCFDMDYLNADPINIKTFIDDNIPSLEPRIPFRIADDLKQLKQTRDQNSIQQNCNRYIDFFEKFTFYSESILERVNTHTRLAIETAQEQRNQSIALEVAFKNLKLHTNQIKYTTTIFLDNAEIEIQRQDGLLESFVDNMKILDNIKVNQSIIDLLEHGDKVKLIQFMDIGHIEELKLETLQLSQDLKKKSHGFINELKYISKCEKDLELNVKNSSNFKDLDIKQNELEKHCINAIKCNEDIQRGYKKALDKLISLKRLDPLSADFQKTSISNQKRNKSSPEKEFETLDNLAIYQLNDPVYKLQRCDSISDEKVAAIIRSKRKSTEVFFETMRVIAQIQGHISELQGQLNESDDQLKKFQDKYGENDLRILRRAVLAYGALLIEIVRRKDYKQILVKNVDIIADILSDYRNQEEKRRNYFLHTVKKLLPFELTRFDNILPQSEITLYGTNEQNTIKIDKRDVQECISMLQNAYRRESSISLTKQSSFASSSSSIIHPSFARSSKKSLSTSVKPMEKDKDVLFFDDMSNELNNLGIQFLKTVESNFFPPNQIGSERIKEVIEKFEETLPIESSIEKSIEKSIVKSTNSFTYSVVDDDNKLITATIDENNRLKDILLRNENEIEVLQLAIKNLKSEKEELESQANNFDNERQTFEQNKQSFINELKNKDKTADFRIASAEEDFQSKISDLQYALEEEQRMKKNLEIEHASELNTLNSEHASEIENLKELLRQERQKTQEILNEKSKEKQRADETTEIVNSLQFKLNLEKEKEKELLSDRKAHKNRADSLLNDKKFLKEHISNLTTDLEKKKKVLDEIQLVQQHTKDMVARTQQDWMDKDLELKQCKGDQENVNMAVRELLSKFRDKGNESIDFDLKRDVKVFKKNLEEYIDDRNDLQQNFDSMTEELAQLSESNKNLNEIQFEWRAIASRMAEKLEEFRKNILYELVVKLQLPMDESELYTLSRNLSPSDDDAAIWNEVLQLSSGIHTQKFVKGVLEHAKNLYDNYVIGKNQLKKLKVKYNHLLVSNSERISFRNFRVGDVALFLPTRNSTGKPWAAFNINAPHYFLHSDDTTSSQMQSREWIVARIVSITENTVDENINPYGLALGLKYYDLQVENWRANRPNNKSKKRLIEPDSGLASLGSGNATPPKRPSFSSIGSSSTNIVHSYINK